MLVVFDRLIPAGQPNVNSKKVYRNLEPALKEYFEKMSPVYIDSKTDLSFQNFDERSIVDITDVVGIVKSYDDTTFTVEIVRDIGIDYRKYGIGIQYMCAATYDTNTEIEVLRLYFHEKENLPEEPTSSISYRSEDTCDLAQST